LSVQPKLHHLILWRGAGSGKDKNDFNFYLYMFYDKAHVASKPKIAVCVMLFSDLGRKD
jgi:hypothetical protein